MVNQHLSVARFLESSAKYVTLIFAIGAITACAGGRQALPSSANMSVFHSSAASTVPGQQPGLVFSNTLASKYNVLHSSVGPNLEFCHGQDGCTQGPYVAANPAYVQGHGMNMHAITIGPGNYFGGARVINVILPDLGSVVNSDQGTISVWFKANAAPVAYQYGVYRIFGGSFGLGNPGVVLYMDASDRLYFTVGATDPTTAVTANSVKDRKPGMPMTRFIGQWIHIQAVWNRNGIGTSGQTLQLFINSGKTAVATASGWSTDVGTLTDIAGGNDGHIDGKFDEGQLEIYNTNP